MFSEITGLAAAGMETESTVMTPFVMGFSLQEEDGGSC